LKHSSRYAQELSKAMEMLSLDSRTIFIGQATKYAGTSMSSTFENVDRKKLLEFPVDEDFQMGVSVGLALQGFLPISIFPRWNFLLLAANQLVNHLDKMKELLGAENIPKVIIRTAVGSVEPLYPGPQHDGDFTSAFEILCPNLNIVKLETEDMIYSEYKKAYARSDNVSTILVEISDKFNTK
jgi:pyruvate/2-oxoglutarate/acetoin dehydrogenase E1 component